MTVKDKHLPLLERERETLERLLPDLDSALAELPLMEMERRGNPAIELFREAGGPGLLIPTRRKGLGASALDAVRVQRAVASRSPSLGIASTMHHFSVATFNEFLTRNRSEDASEWMLMEGVAQNGLLVASGFSEGNPGQGVLSPTMDAYPVEGGYLIRGSKKPCSLSGSMSLLTASVRIVDESADEEQNAVAVIWAETPGIERRPFWNSWVLAGAESEEVVMTDVMVPEDLVFTSEPATADGTRELDELQIGGFVWFELLVTASYIGVASALVERAIKARKGDAGDRARLGIELEAAMAALEGIAAAIDRGEETSETLPSVLMVRYSVQGALGRVVSLAVELLGGGALISSPDVAYLAAAAQALQVHPPSRPKMSRALASYLETGVLDTSDF